MLEIGYLSKKVSLIIVLIIIHIEQFKFFLFMDYYYYYFAVLALFDEEELVEDFAHLTFSRQHCVDDV